MRMAEEPEENELPKRFVSIRLEPPIHMTGPMGTAIISEIPSYRIACDASGEEMSCLLSRLARRLADYGMTEECIRQAIAKAQALEDPGEFIEIEIY
jgi:hypothetical protein